MREENEEGRRWKMRGKREEDGHLAICRFLT
jgi:hypothetical protein